MLTLILCYISADTQSRNFAEYVVASNGRIALYHVHIGYTS